MPLSSSEGKEPPHIQGSMPKLPELIGRNSRFWQNILSNMAKSRSKSWPLTLRRPESGVHSAVLPGGQKSGLATLY